MDDKHGWLIWMPLLQPLSMKTGNEIELVMNLKMTVKMKTNPITSAALPTTIDVYSKLDDDGGTKFASNASTNGKDITFLVNTR